MRNAATKEGKKVEAEYYQKLVKQSARADRRVWLQNMASSGDWSQLKTLRKGSSTSKGRLRNLSDEVVSSDRKAETLAEYFEKVQW